jgi:hypothetical protein
LRHSLKETLLFTGFFTQNPANRLRDFASTLYRHGAEVLRTLIDGVRHCLESNDYQSLEQVKGILSQRSCPDPAAFERANYTKALSSFLSGAEPNHGSVGSAS